MDFSKLGANMPSEALTVAFEYFNVSFVLPAWQGQEFPVPRDMVATRLAIEDRDQEFAP